MKTNPNKTITITGSVGGGEIVRDEDTGAVIYDPRLAEKRAKKIADMIVGHGVSRARITIKAVAGTKQSIEVEVDK